MFFVICLTVSEIYQVKVSKIEQGIRPVFDYELGELSEALEVSGVR